MLEKRQFETCIMVEYCNLTLREGYQIGKELEAFLKVEKLGYYYGSSRQADASLMCFKFFLHVPTHLYPRALSSIFRKVQATESRTLGRVVTNHSWFVRREKNTELYSRIMGLVRVLDTRSQVSIRQPEMVAMTLSTLPEEQYDIREENGQAFIPSEDSSRVMVCIR